MARWEPGTQQRLAQAALDLFTAQGFEQTTTAQIAESVGVTERTFFRHFADKREVLFAGQELLGEAFLRGIDSAPADAAPLDVVAAALRSGAAFFTEERRAWSRARQWVIDANPGLQERERHKMAALAGLVHDALLGRGVADPVARLAAETGTTVFGIAFTQWIGDDERRSLVGIGNELLGELRVLAGAADTRPVGTPVAEGAAARG